MPYRFSPYEMEVLPKFEARKVTMSDLPVHQELYASFPVELTIHTKHAGNADLTCEIIVSKGVVNRGTVFWICLACCV